jgi:hypothetical protein
LDFGGKMEGRVPPKKITPIDPKKFLGGENLEKLKGMFRDADGLINVIKNKSPEVMQTFERLKEFTNKFGETVEFMHEVAEANKQIMATMLKNMGSSFQGIMEGKDGGRQAPRQD